jgi:TolB protein
MKGWRGAVLLIAAMALVAPSVASATFPGRNGKLVFEHTTAGIQLFTIEPSGAGLTQLTDLPDGAALEPSWSPDGTNVAFRTLTFPDPVSVSSDLYLINADGSGLRKIGPGVVNPAWSPDGRKLAFSEGPPCSPFFPPCAERDIYTVNADGTGERTRITNANGVDEIELDWSPDGSRIAFSNGSGGIWTVGADGAGLVKLTGEEGVFDRMPSWAPDSRRIAFMSDRDETRDPGCGSTCNREIYVIDADGSGETRVTNTPAIEEWPAWSPDGRRIAFRRAVCTDSGCGPSDIFTMNVDGTDVRNVTNDPGHDDRPDWQPLVGPRREDYKNASKFCKAEREFLGQENFRQRYGGDANAHGRCVSGKGA